MGYILTVDNIVTQAKQMLFHQEPNLVYYSKTLKKKSKKNKNAHIKQL